MVDMYANCELDVWSESTICHHEMWALRQARDSNM